MTVRDDNPERESTQSASAQAEPLLVRLHRALGPLAGGIILDVVDLATFGPIGLAFGWLVGGLVGWWVSSIYGFSAKGRLAFALLCAVYITIPFTGLFPLATIISSVARFRARVPE